MNEVDFKAAVRQLLDQHEQLLASMNAPIPGGNGVFVRYANPVLTSAHAPVFWRRPTRSGPPRVYSNDAT